MASFTNHSLRHLRQLVRKIEGGTDHHIIWCANKYFSKCNLVELAEKLATTSNQFDFQWTIIRWRFKEVRLFRAPLLVRIVASTGRIIIPAQARQPHFVLNLRYKANPPGGKVLVERRFTLEKGKLIANHDYLVLPIRLQGSNFSRMVNSIMYDVYNQLGVKIIKVYAGFEAGGYVWAKAGFSATLKKEVYYILAQAREKVDAGKTNVLTYTLLDALHRQVDRHYQSKSTPFPIWQWTRSEAFGSKFGKELLLGTDWHGELDLKDDGSRSIFEDYLSKK